jgi:hypothetical protein
MDRDELLRVEQERWGEFSSLVRRITPDRMESPTLNGERWSVKDLLWHMRCWSSVVADQLERIHDGTFGAFEWNTEENNARFLAEGRTLDLAIVRTELVEQRDRGRRAMESLSDVSPTVEELFSESAYKHVDDHLLELRRFVQLPA